ncbi:MAG TPA: AAA family ATPase [Clostridiales bacterium]|nr:AAA family ATPase [Clostridiales bacterium]
MKKFNIAGVCIPDEHYMVDTSDKIKQIEMMIEDGSYFTINRSRQFGKTTTISMIAKYLKDKYVVLKTSFEPTGESLFKDEETFCSNIFKIIAKDLEYTDEEFYNKILSYGEGIKGYDELSRRITKMSIDFNKLIVLLIDEVDQASNNAVFLKFLGVLRSKYMDRNIIPTFKSVILAGVHDIKSLKLLINEQKVITADEAREIASDRYNSPWNIAADFEVDMTFNPKEIATMLVEYEKENKVDMNIEQVSQEIYRYTSGYPFLVSKVCKVIDEKLPVESERWGIQGVEQAVKIILKENSTLFESLIKNLENDEKLYNEIYDIVIEGRRKIYNLDNQILNKASMYGIISEDKNEKVKVHNIIFEKRIYNYMISKRETSIGIESRYAERNKFVNNGILHMELVLEKFQELMMQEYRKKDEDFIEKKGRLIFLAFIKPIINGVGDYFIEPEMRDSKKMDIVIKYGIEKHIIELKIWHGEKYEERGVEQLLDYMKIQKEETGYMVVFDFRKEKKEYKNEWIEVEGRRIFEVVV